MYTQRAGGVNERCSYLLKCEFCELYSEISRRISTISAISVAVHEHGIATINRNTRRYSSDRSSLFIVVSNRNSFVYEMRIRQTGMISAARYLTQWKLIRQTVNKRKIPPLVKISAAGGAYTWVMLHFNANSYRLYRSNWFNAQM